MTEIGIGIVGFGRIGAEHAQWITRAPGLRVAAVADSTPARRDLAASRGFRTHPTINSLLADPDVHAVLVSTPTAMHFDESMRALDSGRHVMVEKPMSMDLPQARQMIAEAERRNLVLSVFHNRRWDLDYLTVAAAVARGDFGRVLNVESRLHQYASCVGPAAREYRPEWRNEAAYGGGGLYDWGSHFLDQLWRLLLPAKPVRVFAQLRGNVWSTDCDDFARLCIDFDNGSVALLEINTTTLHPGPRWHIDGTAGGATSPASPTFDTRQWAQLDFTAVGGQRRALPLAPPGLDEPAIWAQFAAAIRGQGPPAVPARSVLPTMALLDAARTSSREGRAVECESL